MKKPIRIIFIISVCLLTLNLTGQDNCKVLKETISTSYQGECKNGLAHGHGKAFGLDQYEGDFKKGLPHGNGTYIWKSGDTYTGSWKKGEMSGKGTMHVVSGGRDTTYTGIWNRDVYEGPEMEKPKIRQKVGVDRYNIGMPNTSVTDFTINVSSGIESKRTNTYIYDEVTFPVECILRYKTWNKLHTAQHDVIFNFVIEQEGEWEVDIHN